MFGSAWHANTLALCRRRRVAYCIHDVALDQRQPTYLSRIGRSTCVCLSTAPSKGSQRLGFCRWWQAQKTRRQDSCRLTFSLIIRRASPDPITRRHADTLTLTCGRSSCRNGSGQLPSSSASRAGGFPGGRRDLTEVRWVVLLALRTWPGRGTRPPDQRHLGDSSCQNRTCTHSRSTSRLPRTEDPMAQVRRAHRGCLTDAATDQTRGTMATKQRRQTARCTHYTICVSSTIVCAGTRISDNLSTPSNKA